MLSPSLEDYLEEVYRLYENNKEIRVSDIAVCLEVSLPSVVNGLKKLQQRGYLLYENYGKIKLTSKGKQKGKFLVNRNSILKEFLRLMYCTCDIDAEAEAIEHYVSNSTIELVKKMVEFMKKYPYIRQKFKEFCEYNDEEFII